MWGEPRELEGAGGVLYYGLQGALTWAHSSQLLDAHRKPESFIAKTGFVFIGIRSAATISSVPLFRHARGWNAEEEMIIINMNKSRDADKAQPSFKLPRADGLFGEHDPCFVNPFLTLPSSTSSSSSPCSWASLPPEPVVVRQPLSSTSWPCWAKAG